MINIYGINYRILYEFNTDRREVLKNSGLYCNISIAVDFYLAHVVIIRTKYFIVIFPQVRGKLSLS